MSFPLLLSFRAAAKMLGVGRNDLLHALIKAGLLRPVTLLGRRSYIPREQVESLARNGDTQPSARDRQVPRNKAKAHARTTADVEI